MDGEAANKATTPGKCHCLNSVCPFPGIGFPTRCPISLLLLDLSVVNHHNSPPKPHNISFTSVLTLQFVCILCLTSLLPHLEQWMLQHRKNVGKGNNEGTCEETELSQFKLLKMGFTAKKKKMMD